MNVHISRWGRFLFCLLFCCLAAGCGGGGDKFKGAMPSMPSDVAAPTEAVPERIPVDVYWDVTPSMKGYATLTGGNNVFRILADQYLGDIGNSMGEVKFFRFGKEVMPLSGREYLNFRDPSYYDNADDTYMQKVVDVADASHLSVVVTDLFENDADWTNVTSKLTDKYLRKHMAVAVIGIKNPFQGVIYDIGPDKKKLNYDSGTEPGRFRPFYLFVMGPDSKVREFVERWKDRQDMPNEIQYILLSENLMEKAGDFSNLSIRDGKNLLLAGKLNLTDKQMKEFGLKSEGETAELTVGFDYSPLFGSCPVDMDKLKTDVQVFALTQDGAWEPVATDSDAKVEISADTEQEGKYIAMLSFSPSKTLVPGRINLLHVSVSPTQRGYLLPAWVKKWSTTNIDEFDGSKTTYFERFIGSLKDSSLAAAHPAILNMNLVFDLQ